jgi:tetratricopeptide (TPR) repeat protein
MSDDANHEIVAELRKPRRYTLVFLAAMAVGFSVVVSHSHTSSHSNGWDAVRSALDHLDYAKALSLAQANVALQPDDYYGHSYLGSIYLAMDDVTNSEAQYLRAYELFPSRDNGRNLAAVRKRIAELNSKPPNTALEPTATTP